MKSLVLIFFICILPHHSIESQKYDHPSGSIQLTCAYPGGRPTSVRTGNVSTHLVPKYNAPNSYVLRAKPKEKRQLLIQSIHCISFQCLCGLCNQSFESTYIYFEHDQFIEDRVLKMDPPIDDFVAFLRETFSKPINSKEFLFICFLTNTDTTIFNKHTDPYNYQTPSTSLFGIIFLTTCIVLVFVLCFGWFIVIYYRRFRQYRLKKKLRQALAETTQQILDKSPVITFDPNNRDPDQTDSEPMCAICLEIFKSQENVRKLICKHFFHVTCIDPWLLSRQSCPLCNRNILRNSIPSISSNIMAAINERNNDLSTTIATNGNNQTNRV